MTRIVNEEKEEHKKNGRKVAQRRKGKGEEIKKAYGKME